MKMANIAEAKDDLSALIRLVEAGEEVIICRYNRPVARLVPIEARASCTTRLGWAVGEGEVHDDLQGPFIPPSDWAMLADESV